VLKNESYPPQQLEIEITESIAMRDPEQVSSRVAGLRQLGIRFAIDDFGAGYSNLATLARLPFDTLKLDRSLITNVANDPEKQSILRIALGLAKELGFESVAEGVETLEDLKFVANAGATMGQGYVQSCRSARGIEGASGSGPACRRAVRGSAPKEKDAFLMAWLVSAR